MPPPQAVQKAEPKKFDWKPYLDPSNKEFFREGDYTPPEPFMELARDPSDENLKNWFSYIKKKNELSQRLSQRMTEFLAKNSASLPKVAQDETARTVQSLPLADDEFERYRFRMYFDSDCPHCQRMFATLNDLQDRGYFVEARQIDRGSTQHLKSQVAIAPATPDEVKKFRIQSVPFLLIGDLKTKKVFKQSGFFTPEEILQKVHQRKEDQ